MKRFIWLVWFISFLLSEGTDIESNEANQTN